VKGFNDSTSFLVLGDLTLSIPAILAPMAGISDLPYRTMARRFGCPLAFTEMVNAKALVMRNIQTQRLLDTSDEDKPLGVQLLGREPDHLRGALDVLSEYPHVIVDLNAACPVRKVVKKGEGAALLKEPLRLNNLVKALVQHTSVPVTVKIRSGWDQQTISAVEIAKGVADAGAAAICVHGRTRSQGYTGRVDSTIIGKVKEAVSIPVIASGDVFSVDTVVNIMKSTGCDAVMIARGGLGNPWLFQDLTNLFSGNPANGATSPSRPLSEIADIMNTHLSLSADYHGEKLGVINFRKFFAWYTKGIKNARHIRPEAVHANTIEEMRMFIRRVMEAGTMS
jgi:tRNA-dihydrouridine synthase B